MKAKLILLVLLLNTIVLFAQQKGIKPLIIQGKLSNCPETSLMIYFYDEHDQEVMDTIKLAADGSFYLKTYKIRKPQLTNIWQKRIQVNNVFVTPGYDLTITGNGANFDSLLHTVKITGLGAQSNRYRDLLNGWYAKHKGEKQWYQLNGPELLTYAAAERKTKDSLTHVVFDAKAVNDPYFNYFKRMVLLDNQFINMYYLLAYVNQHKLSYDEGYHFVNDNYDKQLLAHLVNDDYLISREYKNWIIGGEYTDYLLKLDYQRDSTLRKKKGYRLEKMAQVYTGKARDYVLYKQMSNDITFAKNYERLNYCREIFKPYMSAFGDKFYTETLTGEFVAKEAELTKTAVGKPAPTFALTSDKGTQHQLADYKGKVVYLDLWASWCGPCREQTPHLTTLYNKYKSDDRIAFISVAVSDGKEEWLKALAKDQPGWLQLMDKDDAVKNAYVANMIPQFIIINKKGEIVNFNAPEPGAVKSWRIYYLRR